jgi:hypothetical protein
MSWFRFYEDTINDAAVQRLPSDKFKAWVNLLCIASKHDGVLPPVADIAFMLRLAEDKVAALLGELHQKGLLDAATGSYTPHNWAVRQFKSDVTDPTAAIRNQRYREKKRNSRNAATGNDRNAAVSVTHLDKTTQNRLEGAAVTGDGLIEVTDEAALLAWDEHLRATTGRTCPRNRRGGWRLPSTWPPGWAHLTVVGRRG